MVAKSAGTRRIRLDSAGETALKKLVKSVENGGNMIEGGWEIQRIGNEWAVRDTRTNDLHILNRNAYLIWEKARAGLDRNGIAEDMKHLYPGEDSSKLDADIRSALARLEEIGLLGAQSGKQSH